MWDRVRLAADMTDTRKAMFRMHTEKVRTGKQVCFISEESESGSCISNASNWRNPRARKTAVQMRRAVVPREIVIAQCAERRVANMVTMIDRGGGRVAPANALEHKKTAGSRVYISQLQKARAHKAKSTPRIHLRLMNRGG